MGNYACPPKGSAVGVIVTEITEGVDQSGHDQSADERGRDYYPGARSKSTSALRRNRRRRRFPQLMAAGLAELVARLSLSTAPYTEPDRPVYGPKLPLGVPALA